MSYCRWSDDNFRCDLYVYESDDGYVIHVADRANCNQKLQYNGKTLVEKTLPDLLARIKELVDIGYYVPDWAITRIEGEIKENER